jgi:hypothetical protein
MLCLFAALLSQRFYVDALRDPVGSMLMSPIADIARCGWEMHMCYLKKERRIGSILDSIENAVWAVWRFDLVTCTVCAREAGSERRPIWPHLAVLHTSVLLVDLGKLTYWGIRSSSSWEKRWPCLIETAAGTRRHPVPRGW